MYDTFTDLTTNLEIARPARTSHYWLGGDDLHPPALRVPSYDRNQSFIFTCQDGFDRYYLLNRANPCIDTQATRIPTAQRQSGCMDVVFIDNGEPLAEAHYARLVARNLPNRLVRVSGVQGRNNAYKHAARASNTAHFYAVFAKLEIDAGFRFDHHIAPWDRRHYVFKAQNPVNGLCYGHQGVILYNKAQVLANPGTSIDFTMAQLYAALDTVCGVAHYNTCELASWRCAFREALKLAIFDNEISKPLLAQWQTGTGPYAQASIQGAKDAIAYHARFKDDPKALQKSYEWEWLEHYFNQRP